MNKKAKRGLRGVRPWGGKKAGLWLGCDVWVDGGLLRSVTSPAQRGRSDAVAAGRVCVAVTCDTDIRFTLSLA